MKISADVLDVLSRGTFENGEFKLPEGQLDRKLYKAVDEALTLAGGKWTKGAKAHVFSSPEAEDVLTMLIGTGEILNPKDFGYWPTPAAVAGAVIELAGISPGMTILEPSAGTGGLALPLATLQPARLDCVELLPTNAGTLAHHLADVMPPGRYSVEVGDFLKRPVVPIYDRVIMNPPFELQADAKHIDHARLFLRPGGRLVSIVSGGFATREVEPTRGLRWLIEREGGRVMALPPGSFKLSGTMVNTAVVVIDRGM